MNIKKNLIIESDEGITKEYILKKWIKNVSDDTINITLITLKKDINYEITIDKREPNLKNIEDFITDIIENAIKQKTILYISEYLQRSYIYINFNDKRKQFTAHKKD